MDERSVLLLVLVWSVPWSVLVGYGAVSLWRWRTAQRTQHFTADSSAVARVLRLAKSARRARARQEKERK